MIFTLRQIYRSRNQVYFNGDVVADESRILFVRIIDAEFASVQNDAGRIANGLLSLFGVLPGAVDGEGECDLFRHSVHRQRSMSDEVFALLLDA